MILLDTNAWLRWTHCPETIPLATRKLVDEASAAGEQEATAEVADIDAAKDAASARRIPLWPIIGICLGAAVLIWLFFARRRKDEEDA